MDTITVASILAIAFAGTGVAWWSRRYFRTKRHLNALRPSVITGGKLAVTSASTHNLSTLTLLTHNVFIHHFLPAPQKQQRLRSLAQAIVAGNYDVIAVQEMFCWSIGRLWFTRCEREFREALQHNGYAYATNPMDSRAMVGHNSGLVLYSRHPITEARFFPFRVSKERFNHKGVIVAELTVHGRQVFLLTAHLDSRAVAVKQQQIDDIAALVAEVRRSWAVPPATTLSIPAETMDVQPLLQSPLASTARQPRTDTGTPPAIILCGDFNVCPRTKHPAAYSRLATAVAPLVDVLRTAALDGSLPATHMKGGVLDHVFIGRCAAEEEGSGEGSSTQPHAPVGQHNALPHSWGIRNFRTPTGMYVSDHSGVEVAVQLQ